MDIDRKLQHLKMMTESIDRYVEGGVPTGSFLEAVISNDLREAMGRADETSRVIVFEIVSYLHNEVPGGCWGTPEAYREWLAADPDDRLRVVAPSGFGRKRGIRAPALPAEEKSE